MEGRRIFLSGPDRSFFTGGATDLVTRQLREAAEALLVLLASELRV